MRSGNIFLLFLNFIGDGIGRTRKFQMKPVEGMKEDKEKETITKAR